MEVLIVLEFYTMQGKIKNSNKDLQSLFVKKEYGNFIKIEGEIFFYYCKRYDNTAAEMAYIIDPKTGLSVCEISATIQEKNTKWVFNIDKLYRQLKLFRQYKKTEYRQNAIKEYKKLKAEAMKNKADKLPK